MGAREGHLSFLMTIPGSHSRLANQRSFSHKTLITVLRLKQSSEIAS